MVGSRLPQMSAQVGEQDMEVNRLRGRLTPELVMHLSNRTNPRDSLANRALALRVLQGSGLKGEKAHHKVQAVLDPMARLTVQKLLLLEGPLHRDLGILLLGRIPRDLEEAPLTAFSVVKDTNRSAGPKA